MALSISYQGQGADATVGDGLPWSKRVARTAVE
jgi:hypothetical protein